VIQQNKLAILVGGGPAPGINSVISAATIRANLEGVEVLGVQDGFKWLMEGNVDHIRPLDIDDVSQIHFRGGSCIGISRANPTKDPKHLENTVVSLLRLGVTKLITIGGDDTCYSSMKIAEKAEGRLHVVHVPKTIDNDLELPPHIDTFGYQTARHLGTEIVKNIMVDSTTTTRWYFIIAMGRSAGHLALGIGAAAGATLSLIPEEFKTDGTGKIPLKTLVDTLAGSIIKRMSAGKGHGVAVIAEGVVLNINEDDLAGASNAERDAHGHLRIAEVNIGEILKDEVQKRLKQFSIKTTIVAKNIGYELRCMDPIPSDLEYTRQLGFCAAKHILESGTQVMVSVQNGRFVPIPYAQMLDPKTGRTRARLVDLSSVKYGIARRFMIRLRKEDFEDAHELAKFAATAGISLDNFRKEFEHVLKFETPPLVFDPAKGSLANRHIEESHKN